MVPDEAFGEGFLEKLAEAGWLSSDTAKAHAKKHAGEMYMTPKQYFEAARSMRDRRESLKKVPDKKVRGGLVYWDSATGQKIILSPKGEILSFYNAGARP